jgi:hypothetical protein
MGSTMSVATLPRTPGLSAVPAVYTCMRAHHLNAKQARTLVAKGAEPAFVIAVSPTCPACISLLQILENMCVQKDSATTHRRLYTMDIDTVRAMWPSLHITHVPQAIYVNGAGTPPQLQHVPLATVHDVRNLTRRVVLTPT